MQMLKVVLVLGALMAALSACDNQGGIVAQRSLEPVVPPLPKVSFDPARCTLQKDAPYEQTVGITGSNMMVTSADVQASAAGCKVLAQGGSAIDAAIAVQAVLGVVEPFASGLAGGALITYYDAASNKVRTFDGLSAAPAMTGGVDAIYKAAVTDDLKCKSGLTVGVSSLSSQQGNTNISGRAVGVPGSVKVLDLVHQQYGKTAWNRLWDDAIALAENGFPMTRYMYKTLYNDQADYDEDTGLSESAGGVAAWVNSAGTVKGAARCQYADIRHRYCDLSDATKQKPLAIGTLIQNKELANTMVQLRDGGAQAFYQEDGPIAQAILQRFAADKTKPDGSNNCYTTLPVGSASAPAQATTPARIPSLMAANDFGHYHAVERSPLQASRFGSTIYTQPAPSFGGVVVLTILGLLERTQLQQQPFNSAAFVHQATTASRLANADRRNIVGDPDYSNIDERVAALLTPAYLDARAALITDVALASVPVGDSSMGIPAFRANNVQLVQRQMRNKGHNMLVKRSAPTPYSEDWNTTSNLAIVDGYGNALAMTTTINTHWGAHIEAAGMMLNNALSNFSAGDVGADVNGLAPNKRPRTSIAPSMAFDAQRRLRLVWGAAGGGPIPDYIVKTFLGNVVYDMDLQAAINADNWTGQNSASSASAGLESGKPIALLKVLLMQNYGYSSSALAVTGLTSGLSGIAVSYPTTGLPTYQGAADNRRNGGAVGY
ncbi:gamma-glutamyltransferase [Neisseriaceae bacterium TC5R-5]|nr:gamma-glutamyltransferase [Neisseriaceae bacterium TC5R-5]